MFLRDLNFLNIIDYIDLNDKSIIIYRVLRDLLIPMRVREALIRKTRVWHVTFIHKKKVISNRIKYGEMTRDN